MTSTARGAERDRGQARRAAQALLGARVDGVDPPGVDLDRDAAERGHGVDGDQGAGLVGDLGDLLDRLPGAGGRLGVDDADDLRADSLDGRRGPRRGRRPRRRAARSP